MPDDRDALLEALAAMGRELDGFEREREIERQRLASKWPAVTDKGLLEYLRTPEEREIEARGKGERALSRVNDDRKRQREAQEDKHRRAVEERLQAGKSYQQIATHLGWSKTKVAGAVKRWGLTTKRGRNRSGQ